MKTTILNTTTFIIAMLLTGSAIAQKDNQKIYFDLNVAALKPTDKQKIKNLIDKKIINNQNQVLLFGYADYLGSKAHNDSLSGERAANVRQFLLDNGIAKEKIPVAVGKGSIIRTSKPTSTIQNGSTAPIGDVLGHRRKTVVSNTPQKEHGVPEDRRVEIITDQDYIRKNVCNAMPRAGTFDMQTELEKYRVILPKDKQAYPHFTLPENSNIIKLGNGDKFEGVLDEKGAKTGLGRYVYANDEEYIGYFKNDEKDSSGFYLWPNGDYVIGKWKNGEMIDGKVVVNTKRGETIGEESYNGPLINGMKTGEGIYTLPSGKKFTANYKDGAIQNSLVTFDDGSTYLGAWQNNRMNGKGTFTYANGDVYVGDFVDDKREGNGTMTRKNGDSYAGEWKNGMRAGYGIVTYDGGKGSYKGNWQNNQYNGSGKRLFANEELYDGIFVNNVPHGKGSYTYTDKSVYIGDFKNGMRDGYGELTLPNGDKYTGYWKNDEKYGKGKYTNSDGLVIYDGDWVNNLRQGTGTAHYDNGDSYTGEWLNDERAGKGIYRTSNGKKFDGLWEHNARTGIGTLKDTLKNTSYKGIYANNKRDDKGTYRDSKGNYETQQWENGEIVAKDGVKYKKAHLEDIDIEPEISFRQQYQEQQNIDMAVANPEHAILDGEGTQHYPDGALYSGDFVNNLRQGNGMYQFPNGDEFKGAWNNDLPNGPGKYLFKDGTYYQGNYKDGKKDSIVTYVDEDGDPENMDWKDGKLTTQTTNKKDYPIEKTIPPENTNKLKPADKPKETAENNKIPFIETDSTISIGKQIWMKENLNVSKYKNGNPIKEARTKAEWKKCNKEKTGCWCYYQNNPETGSQYGKLYNWYAIKDKRGLAPPGSTIPEKQDFEIMIKELGKDSAGCKLKAQTKWIQEGANTNETKFTALPTGYRGYRFADFNLIGTVGYYWAATEKRKKAAWSLCLSNSTEGDNAQLFYNYKQSGFAVRCIKKETNKVNHDKNPAKKDKINR